MLHSIVPITASHHIIEMIRRLCSVHFSLDAFKVDLKLLYGVILSDNFDSTFESDTLILKLISSNCFLN